MGGRKGNNSLFAQDNNKAGEATWIDEIRKTWESAVEEFRHNVESAAGGGLSCETGIASSGRIWMVSGFHCWCPILSRLRRPPAQCWSAALWPEIRIWPCYSSACPAVPTKQGRIRWNDKEKKPKPIWRSKAVWFELLSGVFYCVYFPYYKSVHLIIIF